MNTCCRFSKIMMNLSKIASIAIMQLHFLVKAISQSIWVETRIVLKSRRIGMISLWRSTERLSTKSIKIIEQSSSIGLQLMTESRSRQNRIWWTDADYALKLYKKVHNQELDLREPQLSDLYNPSVHQKTGEMIYVGGMALALGLAASRFLWTIIKWKENFQESTIALKAFGRDFQLWRNRLKKLECLRTLKSFGWWSKPSGRFICLPLNIYQDKLLMCNPQIQ